MRTLGLSLSLLAAVAPVPGVAATRPEPIHPERNNVPPSIRRDLVLADLQAILTDSTSPTNLVTTPYLSSRDGLCRRDVIHLSYEREGAREARGPFKPVGVAQVSTQYHRLGYGKTQDRENWRTPCRELSGQPVYWAASDRDATAEFALSSLDMAVADVRRNERVTIDCEDIKNDGFGGNCASEFLAAAARVSRASRCLDEPRDVRSQCFAFEMGDYEVSIIRTYGQGGYSTVIDIDYAQIVVF